MAQREQDQNELLNQYQTLSEDADLYKHKFENSHKDLSTCKQELVDRENDIDHLQSRVNELEKENTERKFHNRELESKVYVLLDNYYHNKYHIIPQINHLGMVVNQNKDQVKQIQHERDELMGDLSALRDLCGRLERSKEELEKELDGKNLDVEQMHANIDDLENENESLKDELYQKQENLRNVETILQGSRNLEQNCMLEIQVTQLNFY